MIDKLSSLAQLIKQLQQVPYLASKNLYRVANHILMLDEKKVKQLSDALMLVKKTIEACVLCGVWKEKEHDCLICSDTSRDQTVICVVETWQEFLTIEKTGGYRGLYHILGGALSPLEGIGPENLRITQLMPRITDSVKEIILATNQTPEGEATAAYIAHALADKSVFISCLARGVPVGSSLEFMDRLTVFKALSERRSFE